MKVDPLRAPANTQVGHWDWMERATNRLRRIITTALAAVVWKHHRLRLSPALSLLEEDLGRPPSFHAKSAHRPDEASPHMLNVLHVYVVVDDPVACKSLRRL